MISAQPSILSALLPFGILGAFFLWLGPKRWRQKIRRNWKMIAAIVLAFLVVQLIEFSSHPHFPSWIQDTFAILALVAAMVGVVFITRWLMKYNVWVAFLLAPLWFVFTLMVTEGVVGFFASNSHGDSQETSAVLPLTGLFILWIVWLFLNRAGSFRGWYAEQQVARRLKKLTKRYPDDYYIINNVLLQNEQYSSEIDHVVLSRCGVFVIETKGYARVHISGDGRWFSGQNGVNELGDPRKQNAGHIKALRTVLGDVPFFSLVVLVYAEPTGTLPKGVVVQHDVISAIRAHTKPLIEGAQVHQMHAKLVAANADNPRARKEHIRRAQSKRVAAQRVS